MDIIVRIFEQYGWLGILGIALGCILFIGTKYFLKRISKNVNNGFDKIAEKLTEQLAKQNETLTNTIINQEDKLIETMISRQDKVIEYLVKKDSNDKKIHIEMLKKRSEVDEEINESLKEIMNKCRAARTFILEFHNTNENLSGVPFPKYSCNNEAFERGLKPMTGTCRSLPISQLSKIINKIYNSDITHLIYDNMEDMANDNPALYWTISADNITNIIYIPLYNKNNILMGLLVLEFNTEVNIREIVNFNKLQIKSAELTQLLNLRYKYENAK